MLRKVVNPVVQSVDVNELAKHIDINAILERVDWNVVLERVDFNAVLEKVDLDRILDKVDIDTLIQRSNLEEIVARSCKELVGYKSRAPRKKTTYTITHTLSTNVLLTCEINTHTNSIQRCFHHPRHHSSAIHSAGSNGAGLGTIVVLSSLWMG
ncbi:MAG: hypothetical protein ACNA7Y_04725 [Gammaproteobacteria bacterium]